jgi:hypothetical protein
MTDDHIVAEIMRITFSGSSGRPIAGTRVWFNADDGTWRPGKSRIAFKVELLLAAADALTQAPVVGCMRGRLTFGRRTLKLHRHDKSRLPFPMACARCAVTSGRIFSHLRAQSGCDPADA